MSSDGNYCPAASNNDEGYQSDIEVEARKLLSTDAVDVDIFDDYFDSTRFDLNQLIWLRKCLNLPSSMTMKPNGISTDALVKAMVSVWLELNGSAATYEKLIEAFLKIEMKDSINRLIEKTNQLHFIP